jgi:hypothetical protein
MDDKERMYADAQGEPVVPAISASYLFAQMSVWEESDLNSSETGRRQKGLRRSMRRRPRPKTHIWVVGWLSRATSSKRRSHAPSYSRHRGLSVTPGTACSSCAESKERDGES